MSFGEKIPPEEKGDLNIEGFLDSERKELLDGMAEIEENLGNLKQEDIENPPNSFIKEKVEAVRNFIAEHPYLQAMYEGIEYWSIPTTGAIGILELLSKTWNLEAMLVALGIDIAVGAEGGLNFKRYEEKEKEDEEKEKRTEEERKRVIYKQIQDEATKRIEEMENNMKDKNDMSELFGKN